MVPDLLLAQPKPGEKRSPNDSQSNASHRRGRSLHQVHAEAREKSKLHPHCQVRLYRDCALPKTFKDQFLWY